MKKIALIIDDDVINNFVLEYLLKIEMPDVKTVSITSATEGLDFIKENSTEIAFLFLDMNLPHYNGIELVKKLRDQNLIKFPINIITAARELQYCEIIKSFTEIEGVYVKPIKIEDIKKMTLLGV